VGPDAGCSPGGRPRSAPAPRPRKRTASTASSSSRKREPTSPLTGSATASLARCARCGPRESAPPPSALAVSPRPVAAAERRCRGVRRGDQAIEHVDGVIGVPFATRLPGGLRRDRRGARTRSCLRPPLGHSQGLLAPTAAENAVTVAVRLVAAAADARDDNALPPLERDLAELPPQRMIIIRHPRLMTQGRTRARPTREARKLCDHSRVRQGPRCRSEAPQCIPAHLSRHSIAAGALTGTAASAWCIGDSSRG
jgi:hypothetical protein